MKLSELAFIARGKLVGKDEEIAGFKSDSRECLSGDLFFALKGEKSDGHYFLKDVYSKGSFAVVDREIDFSPYVIVDDVRKRMLSLALSKIEKSVKIAITGSNGKTTTKEILSALLSDHGKVLKTEGNMNTDVGISLSILNGISDPDFSVIEMGAQKPGDIENLASIFKPDLSVITLVGSAHSAFIDVPKEKSSIANYTKNTVIYDGDVRLNLRDKGLIYTEFVKLKGYKDLKTLVELDGKIFFMNEIWGSGQIKDLNMALSVLEYLGINFNSFDIEKIQMPSGRMNFERIGKYFLVDDTYNASPESFLNAVTTCAKFGNTIWILAPMKELNMDGVKEQLMNFFLRLKPKMVFTVENDDFYPFGIPYDLDKFLNILNSNDVILVKGSRFYKMERIVKEIKEELKKL
ncbi:UDP-N-acetylmuramoyl-tripeptide--D-alanyl-D-alanine ligase [Athalassotoga sp.]|uniref:UDP-N-acetylmuramoyl-tripeptide--D-alanyl-D- alanine ligase n=1 Tax=Athalassotoga sp. TaxID=2022597 RepID=UPI003D08F6C6